MKWETSLRKYSLAENVSEEEESDEEINELKQRIRIRRRERLVEVHTHSYHMFVIWMVATLLAGSQNSDF